jgi:CO/xanthine dehydrogenase Mo-binding subunit
MDRRQFLKTGMQIGAGIISVRYMMPASALYSSETTKPGMAFASPKEGLNKIGSQRFEGLLKVKGSKLFGIDFRAKDLPGWPKIERQSHILRAFSVNQTLDFIDKNKLLHDLGAIKLVTGDDIAQWGCKAGAPFLMPEFYVPSKSSPLYYGQPLGLITFQSIDEFLYAKNQLLNINSYCIFGKKITPKKRPAYGNSRFVRYVNYSGNEEYSFIKDAEQKKLASNFYIKKIQNDLIKSNWHLIRRRYSTQSVDPMFMEPENGLAWYDSISKTLHLTLGTQSPYDDGVAIMDFFKESKAPIIKKIIINCCFLGGGFGGRDSSDFPIHLAIAALSEPDVSHRIVHTRAEQFQAGIKRHAAMIDINLAVDTSGKFQYLRSNIELDGGGQNNYSFVVQSVAARNAGGIYRFPRSWVEARAYPSPSIPAGSMRGYGTFQTNFALECAIDEAANAIQIDPIQLRLKNAITANENIQTGVKIANNFHAIEVLKAASESSLWVNRKNNKAQYSSLDTLFGTGFAFAAKTFGKGDDACLAALVMDPKGNLFLSTNGVDMGNGSATTLPLSLKSILGRPANGIQTGGSTEFDALKIRDGFIKDDIEQSQMAKDPFWVPLISMSTAASTSAYQLRHSVLEAGKVLLQFGLWPAAVAIWNLKGNEAIFDLNHIRFDEASMIYKDGRRILFSDLASKAYEINSITGVMVHAFYRTRWAKASFKINNQVYTSEIDALSIRTGTGDYVAIPRFYVDFPSTSLIDMNANRISCYAFIATVKVSKSTGEIKIMDAAGFLECGPTIQDDIVEGQMQGSFAMGIGQTLMEQFPKSLADGPGSGNWNLHLYNVPLAKDCALGKTRFNILSSNPQEDPKGMSEVVFNPISSAIVNAVADATEKRFTSLPLTSDIIQSQLR